MAVYRVDGRVRCGKRVEIEASISKREGHSIRVWIISKLARMRRRNLSHEIKFEAQIFGDTKSFFLFPVQSTTRQEGLANT